ncbi:GAF domain-containing protein [Friedmanniella luteola]|uniref:GAF domain-containing protein n=1 Tax=Friedmanniella luteola TaxID=546871 RepID=A0A1H1ZYB1_9ACTN|nr:GAF and ANTAR domain-containing protein [Friedmanniella luteola]SDT38738.1 GAF domain-containing protein [Friedmanniella luteola]
MAGTGQVQDQEDGAAAHALVPLLVDYLEDLAERTAARLGDVAGVAITFGRDTAPVTIGSSSDLALQVDLLQYSIGAGPCLHALRSGEALYVPDLGADDRWGPYGPRAAALGAASCLSIPVPVGDRPAAVVKVYDRRVDGIAPEQRELVERTALDVAGGIGLALHLVRQARELDDRAAAMDRRRRIDLALGMLMERNGSSAAAAFDLLRRYSQNFNVRLYVAAEQMVAAADPALGAVQAPFEVDAVS